VLKFFENTKALPVGMSRFGEGALRTAGLDPLYVPHGVDTTTLYPMDRAEARSVLGLPHDNFVVGMVAANRGNPSRKSLAEAVRAFAEFHQTHSDSVLYLHTEKTGVQGGIDLPELVRHLGLPDHAVSYCDQYNYWLSFTATHMRATFSAMDVLLNPARGEGFGVPIIEAQACGTPVVVTDFTAMPELVGAGWKVTGWREWTAQGSWQMVPDIDSIDAALEKAYASRSDTTLRQQAREFAMQYDANDITERYWRPALIHIQEHFGIDS
jgi:glycosyltransferase involved in cell wall biosynthesis